MSDSEFPSRPDQSETPPAEPSIARSRSLLERLVRHLGTQNWTAIAIEFLVIVFGVFLGFQLNTWNDEARGRAGEGRIIEQLRIELASAIDANEVWIAGYQRHWSDFGDAVMAVQDENGAEALTNEQCLAVWTSHIFVFPVPNIATLDEILSTGAIGSLHDAALRSALLEYDSFRAQTAAQYAFIRQDFANLIDVHAIAFPRRLTDKPTLENVTEGVIPIPNSVECRLDLIRGDQAIRNKLISNLARTTAILQSATSELDQMKQLEAALSGWSG